jgi:pyruvate formate lyase activating enzyme
MSLEDVVEEIQKDQLFYDESGGGVTFSGGEPLMQPSFLLGLLKACGALGIHRTVDTSGLADEQLLLEIADETDLFLYDLKHTDPEKHIEFTGVSNSKILSNLRRLANTDAAINVRVPLVGGFNDDDENIHATADFVRSLSKRCEISLLPFHKSAEDKHWRFGMKYRLQNNGDVSEVRVEKILGVLTGYGLRVRIGG